MLVVSSSCFQHGMRCGCSVSNNTYLFNTHLFEIGLRSSTYLRYLWVSHDVVRIHGRAGDSITILIPGCSERDDRIMSRSHLLEPNRKDHRGNICTLFVVIEVHDHDRGVIAVLLSTRLLGV